MHCFVQKDTIHIIDCNKPSREFEKKWSVLFDKGFAGSARVASRCCAMISSSLGLLLLLLGLEGLGDELLELLVGELQRGLHGLAGPRGDPIVTVLHHEHRRLEVGDGVPGLLVQHGVLVQELVGAALDEAELGALMPSMARMEKGMVGNRF